MFAEAPKKHGIIVSRVFPKTQLFQSSRSAVLRQKVIGDVSPKGSLARLQSKFVPSGRVVKIDGVLSAVENVNDVGFLFGIHDSRADEKRVADNVVNFRRNAFLVEL